MKINAFSLDLSSSRTYSEIHTTQISQQTSFTDLMDFRPAEPAQGTTDDDRQILEMIEQSSWVTSVFLENQPAASLTDQFRAELASMRRIMDSILEQLTGRLSVSKGLRVTQVSQMHLLPVSVTRQVSVSVTEQEQTMVTARGQVQTADNRNIDFSLDLAMAREYFREDVVEEKSSGYVLVDPLVIQTDAGAPLFSGGQFSFDLDSDGTEEDLSLPGAGWAFLCLDKNQDGQINDGSELFGPATNQGFAELAAYDQDQNLWIDENDEVFDQLTLWEQGDEGMTLTRIQDAGIGAIYLAGVPSQFDMTTPDNELMGRVTRTSVALTEAGEPLVVQEVDLATSSGEAMA
jgi:Asp-tRNA(Asn)/Glu-tRNA(Gln) amidotransferase C subunit